MCKIRQTFQILHATPAKLLPSPALPARETAAHVNFLQLSKKTTDKILSLQKKTLNFAKRRKSIIFFYSLYIST
jgi:hypothetical protein